MYAEKDEDMTYLLKTTGEVQSYKTKRTLVEVVPTKEFGECLYLNGEMQLATTDEYIYHEMLVHPCMSSAHSRKRICIVGGGDGCAIREILKWNDVVYIDCIDWDEEFIRLIRNGLLGETSKTSIQDPKVTVEFDNILDVLSQQRTYDIIFLDLLDPRCDSQDDIQFWNTLLVNISKWLAPNGNLVLNGGGLTPNSTKIQEWLTRSIILSVSLSQHELMLYKVFVPSFHREWCFFMIRPEGSVMEIQDYSLRYFDTVAWRIASSWTRDYMELLPSKPIKLRTFT